MKHKKRNIVLTAIAGLKLLTIATALGGNKTPKAPAATVAAAPATAPPAAAAAAVEQSPKHKAKPKPKPKPRPKPQATAGQRNALSRLRKTCATARDFRVRD